MSSEHQPLTVDAIQFQDIAHTQSAYSNVGHSKDISIDIDSKDNDAASLLGHEPNGPGSSTSTYSQVNPPDPNASFYTLAYYRRFFDVNTHDIGQRLLKTLIPSTKPFYEDEMKPDLYGPFWIATTLFILMAVTGNLASYLEHNDGSKWQYDFDKVTLAATLFYCCISILPILIWFGLRRADQTRGLVEVISIHGYALAPYIPAALISTVPVNLLRWIIVGVAFGLSSMFFLTNLWRDRSNKKVFPVICVLIGINAVIALICKLYFFGL